MSAKKRKAAAPKKKAIAKAPKKKAMPKAPKKKAMPKAPKKKAIAKAPKKAGARSRGGGGADAIEKLARVIARGSHPTYAALVMSEPIDPLEVAMAERKLGVKLPPSYVAFVTRHGCFKLLWDKPDLTSPEELRREYPRLRGSRGLLPPAEIASETLGLRESYSEADDPETSTMLDDALVFHENFYRDNFYAFRASDAATQKGEMGVHAFFHDDAFEWRLRYVSFDEHLREWAELVLAER